MSNARSPREVCSTTIGTSGLMVLASFAYTPGFLPNVAIGLSQPDASALGRPELSRPLLRPFLARCPELLPRLRLLHADRFGLVHQQLQRHLVGDVLAHPLQTPAGAQPLEQLLGGGAGSLGGGT